MLSARAAAIRGDDYHHAIAWYWAARALTDAGIVSVSVEDADGKSFDDIVVRWDSGPDTFWQVKTSNFGNTAVDEDWLTTGRPNGRSPLQHFFHTWRNLQGSFELVLITNRGYDSRHAILGGLRDLKSEKIEVERLIAAGPRSRIGQARRRWTDHLGADLDELSAFLERVSWKIGPAESDWDSHARAFMALAGLRSDAGAVAIGKALIREWVTTGAGERTAGLIRRDALEMGLRNPEQLPLAAQFITYVDLVKASRADPPVDEPARSELRAVWNDDAASPGWKPLWANVSPPEYHTMLVGPHGHVTSVDLCTIDGETLAVTGGDNGVMFLWDAATGSRRWEVPAHDGRISDVRFLPMAETTVVISAGNDAVVRVWDVRSKRQLVEFSGHTGHSVSVATGTVGGCAVVISADNYGEIWAWNPADGGVLQNFVLPPATEDEGAEWSRRNIAAVGFGTVQGEPAVAAVKTNGELVCWRYADATILGQTRCQHRSEYMHIMAASSNGAAPLAALLGDAGYHWELWEPFKDLAVTSRLPMQRPEAVSVHGTVAVAVRGEALELWDLAKRAVTKRTRCTASHSSASALLETANGHLAAVGGDDGRVRIYDLPNAVPFPFAGPGIPRGLTSVAIGDTPAGPLAAVGGHHVTILDIDTGDEVRRWPESFDWIRNLRFGTVDDRPVIVSGDDRGFMTVRRADRDRTVATWLTGHGWPLGLAVGRLGDRDVAVTGGQGSEAHVRDLATGDSLGKLSVVSSGQVVDLHMLRSGGRVLLVAAGTANRAIWDLESRQHVADVGFPMTFHPITTVRRRTGDRLVGIGYDQEICYVDLSDGSVTGIGEDCRIDRSIDENASLSVAASPFGDLAVFASSDGIVDTWNLGAAAAVSSIRFDQPVLSLDTTWDERRQRLLAVVGLPNGAACVSFAVDG